MVKIEVGNTYKFSLYTSGTRGTYDQLVCVNYSHAIRYFLVYANENYDNQLVNILHLSHFRYSRYVIAKVIGLLPDVRWIKVDPESVVFSND